MLLPIFKLEENNFPGISKGKILGILELINMLAANIQEHLTLGPKYKAGLEGTLSEVMRSPSVGAVEC